MAEPYLSIIMPAYNAEKTIKKAIDSIRKQEYKDFEVLVIDDCSSDHTRDIISKIAEEDERIILVRQEKNCGPGAAKNRGIEMARGTFLAFCDSDDWIESDMYYDLCKDLKEHETDVIICGYKQEVITQDNMVKSCKVVKMEAMYINEEKKVASLIPYIDEKKLLSFAFNKIYKKSVVDSYGVRFSDKKFGEDFDFNLKYFEHVTAFSSIEKSCYHYQKWNRDSLSERYIPDFFENIRERYQDMRCLLIKKNCFEKETRAIAANVHIKHVIASLVRQCSPKAKLKFKDRYKQAKIILNDQYTREACKYAVGVSKQEKVCNSICKSHNVFLNLVFAKALYIMQNDLNALFEKMK